MIRDAAGIVDATHSNLGGGSIDTIYKASRRLRDLISADTPFHITVWDGDSGCDQATNTGDASSEIFHAAV